MPVRELGLEPWGVYPEWSFLSVILKKIKKDYADKMDPPSNWPF